MIKQGCVACFDDKNCLLISKHHGKIIAEGIRNLNNWLYQLIFQNLEVHANVAISSMELAHLWHHKLGHFNYRSLHNLITNHMDIQIPYIPMHKEVCKSCQFEKQIRTWFLLASQNQTSKPLQLLHVVFVDHFLLSLWVVQDISWSLWMILVVTFGWDFYKKNFKHLNVLGHSSWW